MNCSLKRVNGDLQFFQIMPWSSSKKKEGVFRGELEYYQVIMLPFRPFIDINIFIYSKRFNTLF